MKQDDINRLAKLLNGGEEKHAEEPKTEAKSDSSTPGRRLIFKCLADIEPKSVEWLWHHRIPLGKFVLFTGAPDAGKTQCAIDVAARITKGELWPDGSGKAELGSVIILTAEDGLADTIRTRADAAGADCNRIHCLDATIGDDGNRSTFSLLSDIGRLGDKIAEIGDVRLIIIDPVTAYLGAGKIDTHKTSDVRAVCGPLSEFAEDRRVTVMGITHPPKQGTGKAMHAATGSLAWIAAARTGYLFIVDAENDRTLMLPIKNNLGPKKDGLAFRFAQLIVAEPDIIGCHIVWDQDPIKTTADEAMAADSGASKDPTAKDDATNFLTTVLRAGPVLVAELETEARGAGLLGETQRIAQSKPFRSARDWLGIIPYKGGMKEGWIWSLPPAYFNSKAPSGCTPKMPSEDEDAHFSKGAPSGAEGIFGSDFTTKIPADPIEVPAGPDTGVKHEVSTIQPGSPKLPWHTPEVVDITGTPEGARLLRQYSTFSPEILVPRHTHNGSNGSAASFLGPVGDSIDDFIN